LSFVINYVIKYFYNRLQYTEQTIAENGNIVAAPVKVAVSGNNLLPFSATNCFFSGWQQFVAVFGNKVAVSGNIGNFVAWCGQALTPRTTLPAKKSLASNDREQDCPANNSTVRKSLFTR